MIVHVGKLARLSTTGLLVLALGGCGSPESAIRSDCVKQGGIKFSQEQVATDEQVQRSCRCFAGQLAAAMPKEQLKAVADAMKVDGGGRMMMNNGQVMMAAKSCMIS